MSAPLWIFGYGSLVWRPAIPHHARRPGYITGYTRRFWQASPDHRGTPQAPGRVVTLLREADAVCWGMAYQVRPEDADQVLRALDYRERAGYERVHTEVTLCDQVSTYKIRALVYIAGTGNPNYLGPAPVEDIAEVVRSSRGPSGSNREYVLRLAAALAEMGARDAHVNAIAELVAD